MNKVINRCAWVTDDVIYQAYHDQEWGVPVYDEQLLFEYLILEGQQAGLNWLTVLKKRESLRQAYAGFVPAKLAHFSQQDCQRLMADESIIRNRLKINAAIQNAKALLVLQKQGQSLSTLLWGCVEGAPVINHWANASAVPVMTAQSKAMSSLLKKKGFSFVGPTICYAFMQAVGMVNDHTQDCDCYRQREKQQHH